MGYPRDPKLKGLAAVAYHPEHLSWGTSHVNVGGKVGLVVEPASPAALREAMAGFTKTPNSPNASAPTPAAASNASSTVA